MIYTSLIVEMLRVRPRLVFWLVALAQVALWLAVATLAYSAPPGDLAQTLALGREFRLGTAFGPPLAYWLADLAFELAGGRIIGPYLLAQLCVLVTLWSVMELGRSIVGRQQAVLAILMIVGVFAVTVPALAFGPWVLAMPLWSLTLLHFWRVLGEGRRRFWFALAINVGLMLLTSYVGFVLLVLLAIFLIGTRRGHQALRTLDPWLCLVMIAIVVGPYALWLFQHADLLQPVGGWHVMALGRGAMTWLQLIGWLVLANAGAALLVVIAGGWLARTGEPAPTVTRQGTDPFAPAFVYFFALAAPLAATVVVAIYLPHPPFAAVAPVTVLSALAVIVAAGEAIVLFRQYLLARVWSGLLLAPPLLFAFATVIVPRLLPVQPAAAQPAAAIGKFFSDSFARRTGQPLTIVAGDRRLAALTAVSAPTRPRLYIDPVQTPWLDENDIRSHGAIVLWPTRDLAGAPPPQIAARFPGLVPELPRVFDRTLAGFGEPLRIGWAVIRPRQPPTAQ